MVHAQKDFPMKFTALLSAVMNFMPTLRRLVMKPEPKRYYGRTVRLPENRLLPCIVHENGRCFRSRKQSGQSWKATYMGRRIGG